MNERKKQRGWQAERRPDRTDDPVGRAESVSKTGDWERIDGRASAVERGDWGGSGRNNRPALPVRWLLAAAVLLCTVLAVAGCAGQSGSGYVDAVVERIVDGDTLVVNIRGEEERVRLLLVDTPETSHPSKPVQPFGPEASEFAREVLEGRQVQLEFDGPERDKYDRLLAYVWVDGKLFNEMLLERGLARIAYVYDPPYRHYDLLTRAQEKSRKARIGIWSIEGYVREDGFDEEAAQHAVSGGSARDFAANGQPASDEAAGTNTAADPECKEAAKTQGVIDSVPKDGDGLPAGGSIGGGASAGGDAAGDRKAGNGGYAAGKDEVDSGEDADGDGVGGTGGYTVADGKAGNAGGVAKDGETGAAGAGDDAVPSCPDPKIKGNINSRGEKIYHLPGGRYYKQTKAEQWFCTEEEAVAAGFRAALR